MCYFNTAGFKYTKLVVTVGDLATASNLQNLLLPPGFKSKVETLLEGRESTRVKRLEVGKYHLVDRNRDDSTGGFKKSRFELHDGIRIY